MFLALRIRLQSGPLERAAPVRRPVTTGRAGGFVLAATVSVMLIVAACGDDGSQFVNPLDACGPKVLTPAEMAALEIPGDDGEAISAAAAAELLSDVLGPPPLCSTELSSAQRSILDQADELFGAGDVDGARDKLNTLFDTPLSLIGSALPGHLFAVRFGTDMATARQRTAAFLEAEALQQLHGRSNGEYFEAARDVYEDAARARLANADYLESNEILREAVLLGLDGLADDALARSLAEAERQLSDLIRGADPCEAAAASSGGTDVRTWLARVQQLSPGTSAVADEAVALITEVEECSGPVSVTFSAPGFGGEVFLEAASCEGPSGPWSGVWGIRGEFSAETEVTFSFGAIPGTAHLAEVFDGSGADGLVLDVAIDIDLTIQQSDTATVMQSSGQVTMTIIAQGRTITTIQGDATGSAPVVPDDATC